MSSSGLIFYYGGYQHPAGEVYPAKIEVVPQFTADGVRWANQYTWRLKEDFFGDPELEMLRDLVAINHPAHSQTDLRLAPEGPVFPPGRNNDLLQLLLRCLKKRLALARPLLGQQGVPARNQALTRVLRRGDLSQIPLVKE